MRKYRILVVDDSVVFRRLLANLFSSDPAFELVGKAANGKIALAKIPQVNPDLVILDVEMPVMNGLETLAEIRKTYKKLPVIMFSALTERGADATLDALSLGAADYVTKPSQSGGLEAAMQVLRDRLIPKVKSLCGKLQNVAQPSETDGWNSATTPARYSPLTHAPLRSNRLEIVVIGASTGGPTALAQLLEVLPANFPVPVVIVQHMPPVFTKLLADRLDSKCQLAVHEVQPGVVLEPGTAWIARGDFHTVTVRDGERVRLLDHQDSPQNSCRPSVDVLFFSAANVYGAGVLGVVLTGMGQDGLRGCEAIRQAGGQIVAQDEASSVVWGMPGFVVNANLTDRVLPIEQIGMEIVRRVSRSRAARGTLFDGKTSGNGHEEALSR